ncbi:MAG: hypothetical protein AAGN35_02205 [Bacteroidota bacterium]
MGFKQSYKGIFQFEGQDHLTRAMHEVAAEAIAADEMGLQESYHAEGVMLVDIDLTSDSDHWEEMKVAVATLAMHASRGFLLATAYPEGMSPITEYYEAEEDGNPQSPKNGAAPKHDQDYFPLVEGAQYTFKATNRDVDAMNWEVKKITAHGKEFYTFKDSRIGQIHFNNFWEGTYFYKDGAHVRTAYAATQDELEALNLEDAYADQLVYNNHGQPENEIYTIWNQDNLFGIFVQEDFVDVEVPVGRFNQVMKIRAEIYQVSEGQMHREIQYQYFAQGVGLVLWEKGDAKLELSAYA